MSMKLSKFYSKSLDQRIIIVDQLGTFLASCQRPTGTCSLFYLDGFFAEVWFEGKGGKIFLVLAYNDTDGLKDYLDQISLSSIQHLVG